MSDPRRITVPPTIWDETRTHAALVDRDIGALFRLLNDQAGISQNAVAALAGMGQSDVSAIMRGNRRVTQLRTFERIAEGLAMPDPQRILLGLAPRDLDRRDDA